MPSEPLNYSQRVPTGRQNESSKDSTSDRHRLAASRSYGNTTVNGQSTAIVGDVFGDVHIANTTYLLNSVTQTDLRHSGRRIERSNRLTQDCTIETITTFDDGNDPSTRGSSNQVELRWERKEDLGEGVFGEVHREECVDNQSIKSRAVKVLRLRQLRRSHVDYKWEIGALLRLSQPQYVKRFIEFFSWYEDQFHIYLAMEYIAYGDLKSHIGDGLSEADGKEVGYQILDGIKVMHHLDIVHRDIKPGNIFVVKRYPKWMVKIGDFGFSKSTLTELTTCHTSVGTNGYQAPEITGFVQAEKMNQYSAKCDVWSYGCTMYEILSGDKPFKNNTELFEYCSHGKLPNNGSLQLSKLDTNGNDFIARLLRTLPVQRPSAQEALRIGQTWFNAETLDNEFRQESPQHMPDTVSDPEHVIHERRTVSESIHKEVGVDDRHMGRIASTASRTNRADKDRSSPGVETRSRSSNPPLTTCWMADVIVGIDIGTTFTTVAWSEGPEWCDPKLLQDWPDRSQRWKTANKVPTVVSYSTTGKFEKWGFECSEHHKVPAEELFKPYVNEEYKDSFDFAGRPSHQEAVKFFKDFMISLRHHIDASLGKTIHDWRQRNVEFLFSIPTTWKKPFMMTLMMDVLEEAGFIKFNEKRVRIFQTEAEAAAVNVSKKFDLNGIVTVVDAGGVTTDINHIAVTKNNQIFKTAKSNRSSAEGKYIGARTVDELAKIHVRDRLPVHYLSLTKSQRSRAAKAMMEAGNFERFKHAFGSGIAQPDLHLEIPSEESPSDSRSNRQKVVVTAGDLKGAFDEVLSDLLKQMKLDQVRNNTLRFDHLVLTGGLCESQYVQERLKEQFPEANVLNTLEPELDVVKGLIFYRIQSLKSNSIFETGMSGCTSYGILCRQPYDHTAHQDELITVDPLDKMQWAENQVDWFIKAGEAFPVGGLKKPYQLKLAKGKEWQNFEVQIVTSDLPTCRLPRSASYGHIYRLGMITANFDRADFAAGSIKRESAISVPLENGSYVSFSRGKNYFIAELKLEVTLVAANLRFELRSKRGRKLDQQAMSNDVEWHPPRLTPAK